MTLQENRHPALNPRLTAAATAAVLLASLAALPAVAQAQAAAATPPVYPVRDFFSNPERAYFRLSEDGRWLGYMAPAVGDGGPTPRRNIFVQELKGSQPVGTPRQLTRESARDIGNYRWKGDGTLLYEKDFGGDENFHVVSVDVATGKVTDLTPFEKTRANVINELPEDPVHILVAHNQRDAKVMDVYRVNVKTGAQALVAQNPGNITDWTADHLGRVRLAVASDGVNNTVLYRASEKDAFKPLFTTDFRTQVGPAFFDFDNHKFYAISNRGRDKAAAVLIDPAKPDAETVVYEHPAVDLMGLNYSRRYKVLTTAEYLEEKPGRKIFDRRSQTLFDRLATKLPGYEVLLQATDKAEDKFIVAAFSDRTEGARYIYDAKSDSVAKLGDINPKLPEKNMAAIQPVRYTARDGLVIPAYLTLPPGREAKNLACVVNPHGGPWARDAWGFNPEVQFLANRGYCVLQMNFRGSTGYGR
ncbi:MAG TPA: S9 family peptidase, partial [Ideonella sp.]|nr:S9 family peptidase [Ideonella sp.]